MKKMVLTALAALVLAGCGSGGDSDSTPSYVPQTSSAEGLWNGTTNTNRSITGIILDDGTAYVLYSRQFSNTIAGVVQGTITASNGSYTSNNSKDFNFGDGIGIVNISLSGSYISKQSLTGVAVYGGSLGTSTFSANYSPAYELTPSLSSLSGAYIGQVVTSAGYENSALNISSTGTISGSGSSGCQVTGTASPRSRGNVYNLTITFGGAPCLFANKTFNGIGYYDATSHKLYAAAPNAGRTDGILFVGAK